MSTIPPARIYPVTYFLHAHLANPKTLHKVLGTPHLLKLRKASLPGYFAADNSTVVSSGYGFGEWEAEARLKGVVHYVSNESEEKKLLGLVSAEGEVRVREVEMEVCMGGIWGRKEWVRGCVFEKVEREEVREVREEMVVEGQGKQRAEEVEEEDEMKEEGGEGMTEPGDYKEYLGEDEMEFEEYLIPEPEAYDPIPAEDQTTPENDLVSSQHPIPARLSSLSHLEEHETTLPPATLQHDTIEQATTPCAGLESTPPPPQHEAAAEAPSSPPGPHIARTTVPADSTVKSLVAMYNTLGM